MKRRFSEEQIISILKQQEGGLTVAEVCRQHNVSEASFYAWKSKFGGMSVSDAQKLRALEAENAKLKRVVADLTLDKLALQDVIAKKSLKPVEQRELVAQLQEERGLSQRRAARLIGCNRKTVRHISVRGHDEELRERLKTLAHANLKWGYKLLWGTLRQEGWPVNHKKVYRLYKEERLQLRQKGKKRLKSEGRGLPEVASGANEEWALDFVHDALCDGRSFRTLNVIDAFTRQCLHLECDTSLSSERVVRVLEQLRVQRGKPQRLCIDNGPEFRSKALDVWAKEHGVVLFFIEPGKPTQNGQIESFNGRFRAECLDQEWFTSLSHAKNIIEAWRTKYNTLRPHSSLGYLPPNTWARKLNLSPNLIYC